MSGRGQARWIWSSGFRDSDEELPGKFVLFRRTFELREHPATPCRLNVSADTRYRLFINGTSVAFGPCKSYPDRWYYETIDVQPHLRAGLNVITAKVLRFFPDQIGSTSLMKANVPGFIVWGDIAGTPFFTDEQWQCHQDESIRLQPRSEWNYILGPPFMSLDETVDLSRAAADWQDDEAELSKWSCAVNIVPPVKMMPALEPWKLFERPIPLLPEVPKLFQGALKCSGAPDVQQWNGLLSRQESITIEAHQTVWIEFENSVLTTGFMEYGFIGGNGTKISTLYAESYEKDLGVDKSPFPMPRVKGDRRDFENGRLYGTEDHVTLAADEGVATQYEPFWFRTFRFIRMTITTSQTPMTIRRIAFRETHYPLEITTEVDLPETGTETVAATTLPSTSAETISLRPLWNISLTTLLNCMHETYSDCPFYEQNQFAMDSRLQMLFSYQLSPRSDALARKTIHEFHASRRDDDLLETNFPVSFRAVLIPQFSLFWILMLHDHMMYFGDVRLVRRYLPTADGVLGHFHGRLDAEHGLVGRFDDEAWAFVDWVREWQGDVRAAGGIRNMAVPPVYRRGGIATYNSLVYAWVLHKAADLAAFTARPDVAREYRTRAAALTTAVTTHCFDPASGLFLDGPRDQVATLLDTTAEPQASEHTQVFAVLAGAMTGPAAADLMRRTVAHPTLPRCSFAMTHYVFRALEATGLYAACFAYMLRPWARMVAVENLTTCKEDDVGARSDCHGWSAGVVYEVVAGVWGLRPVAPGWRRVQVRPRCELLGPGDGRIKMAVGEAEVTMRWERGSVTITTTGDVDLDLGRDKSGTEDDRVRVHLHCGDTMNLEHYSGIIADRQNQAGEPT